MLVPWGLLVAMVRRMLFGPAITVPGAAFVYSQVIWDEVWQRPQQYAWLTAAQRPTVYCCPVQMHNLLYLGKKSRPVQHFRDGSRQLLVLSPRIFSGHFKSRLIHEINAWVVAKHIELALPPSIRLHTLVNTPFSLRVLEHLDGRPFGKRARHRSPLIHRLVFDVIDDFTVFDWSPDFGAAFDERLSAAADATVAGTHELAAARPDTPFIACGVDFDLFSDPQPEPAELQNLPRPIIGYFGTISERIDLELIARLAAEFPQGSVVMVGPVHFAADALPRAANIHYLGLRRHTELPAFAQHFTVGLIPFRITEATTRLNPVKTLEYLAAGLPVVATAIPDLVRFYSDLIAIAHTHEEFVARVSELVTGPDKAPTAAGIERARGASWQAMADAINAVVFADEPPQAPRGGAA